MTFSKTGRQQPAHAAEFAPVDTGDALKWADTRCLAGIHQAATVGPGDHIYGPDLKERPVGERYCRNCMDVLGGAR